MASSQVRLETNGAQSGPTITNNVTHLDWMNTDAPDTTGTLYQTHPITAPASGTSWSYTKYQALLFYGTYNSLSSLTFTIANTVASTWSSAQPAQVQVKMIGTGTPTMLVQW